MPVTDTVYPAVNDGRVSRGRSDTLQLAYTDVTGASESRSDTALALEIATAAVVQFYEDAVYSDDVETYAVRNDQMHVVVYDTDQNWNPQSVETVTLTVYVGIAASSLVRDTETLTLTELGETTGIFRSGALAVVDSEPTPDWRVEA